MWVRRWNKQILCVAAGFALFVLAVCMEKEDGVSRGVLERSGYGGGKKTYELLVEGILDSPLPCTVEIEPLQYGAQEAEQLFKELFDRLPGLILGENESLDQVRSDLKLITYFDDTGVRAIWQSRNPEVVDSYGRVSAQEVGEKGERVSLEVTLTDGIHKREGEISAVIRPPLQSPEEKAEEDFKKELRRIDAEHPAERSLRLPEEYEGRAVRYQNREKADYWILPVLGVILAALLYGQEKAKAEREKKERRQRLMLDYADVVYQLMVYTGAGLTIGKSWERMVENYEREKKRTPGCLRPAYEEMALTLHEMQYGMPEGKAIIEFGKRCRLQVYRKLSSLLEQNRKTGTKNLNQLLEQEMISAWEEQKHMAKRMGEEAGTKLLAPLFLMLLVVMVIVMVPAMIAVQ